jgi:hypothetical protein
MGRAGEVLGLVGVVDEEGFIALMEGRDPGTGEQLRRVGGRSKVAAFDLTFSAPKSVSVLFAVGDRVMAGALIWGEVCQVGSGGRAVGGLVSCCGSGCGWRPVRRGRFRLICEGWVPQRRLFAAPGPRSRSERASRGWCS